MLTKICSKCTVEKEVCEFNKRNNSKDTLQSWCKICLTEYRKKYYRDNFENSKNYHKKYYEKNIDKITENTKKYREDNKEKIKNYHKDYYINNDDRINERNKNYYKNNKELISEKSKIFRNKNKDKLLDLSKKYYQNNVDKVKENTKNHKKNNIEKYKEYYKIYNKQYKIDNPEKIKILTKKYKKKKLLSDPIFRLKKIVRSRVYNFLKSKNIIKNNKTFDIVGCTPQFLKEYLENQFTEGMSWVNHSQYGWHIDHIIPLSSANTEEEIYKLCHYTNLQPLWAKDNLIKGGELLI